MASRRTALDCLSVVIAALSLVQRANARGDEGVTENINGAETCASRRPTVLFNRWQEDWSVLADPCVPRDAFDSLKYIPLGGDPRTYLSLGTNLRERVEINNAPLFGLGPARNDAYVIQRVEISADARVGRSLQFFVQLEDARPFGKDAVTPVDRNPVDLEQAFATWVTPLGSGTFKFRVGRQEMAFDLQRFVSVRDGPNVRQTYDAVWADYEYGKWRFIGYLTQPVQNRDVSVFDDVSNRRLTFSGARFERKELGPGRLSGYYSAYNRSEASYLDAAGGEHRNVFDLRYAGKSGGLDWDIESMYQSGHVGTKAINAWAVGSLVGYTFDMPWEPRLALQADAASGDKHPGDGALGTFNPLFPNGYYFTIAGYTGYANVLHIKPSITFRPASSLTLLGAMGFQWRETTADAVYQQPNISVPGTAGHGSKWTGMYMQLRIDWTIRPNLTGAVEAVHFQAGDSIRNAGGHDANYVGVELKYGW